MSFCFITEKTYGEVTISEIMYGSEVRFSPEQWIEISNTGSEPINLTGWTLTIQNVDSGDLLGPVSLTINFRDATFYDAPRIWSNDFLLIVTSDTDDNSGGFMEDQTYDLRWREDLGISFSTTWLSTEGFYIKLTDRDGNVVDEVGNYNGNTTLWDLPYHYNRGKTRAGNRTSLIRIYDDGVALDGTLESSWVSAADAELSEEQLTHYGDVNDISSVGIGPIDFTATNQQPEEPVGNQQPEEPMENQQPEEPAENQQPEGLSEDVNGDGDVNILDLVFVASKFGQTGQNEADVNGDGQVNILDLVRIASAFGKTASAP